MALPEPLLRYFDAFVRKDLTTIAALMAEDAVLQDPAEGIVRGKTAVLAAYGRIFAGDVRLELELGRAFDAPDGVHAVEFMLTIHPRTGEPLRLAGVDCIELRGGLITRIRAYLDQSPTALAGG